MVREVKVMSEQDNGGRGTGGVVRREGAKEYGTVKAPFPVGRIGLLVSTAFSFHVQCVA